jgi:hypothetical protein
MSYIHFKSVCNTNFDKITFDGVNLTLNQLKKLIFEKAKYNKNLNYDLELTNANSNEGMSILLIFKIILKLSFSFSL